MPGPSVSSPPNQATLDAIKAKTDALISDITEENGTYKHPAGTDEEDAVILTITSRTRINNIYLDLTNLTQNCTIRIYAKIDGSTYVLLDTLAWTTTDEDGVVIDSIVSDVDVKVSIQSAISEGAERSIPYRVV